MNWSRLTRVATRGVAVTMVALLVIARVVDEPQLTVAAAVLGVLALVGLVLGGLVTVVRSLVAVFHRTWRRVLILAWPVMVEQGSRTLMRTTDVFITALFSPAAVVAIGLSELYAQFPLRIGLGLGGATIALSSQDTGRGATADRDEATTQALALGVALGVPIALVGVAFSRQLIELFGAAPDVVDLGGAYLAIVLATAPARHVALVGGKVLQGTGDTKTPMYVNLGANGLNIVGSLVLGLGLFGAPELRVVGVGLATATANVVSAVLFLAVIAGSWNDMRLRRPTNPVVGRQLVAIAVPQTVEGFGVALARFPFTALLLLFGTEVNAGYQIGRRLYQQISAPLARAFRTTASITAGQAIGAGETDRARFESWAMVALGVLSAAVIGLVLVVFARPLAGLFTDDPATAAQSTGFIRAFGVAAVPYMIFYVLSGSLRGASETRLPLVARLTGLFGFFLGFSYLAGVTLGFGPVGAYAGIVLSYAWMMIVLAWAFRRGDWAGRATGMIHARESAGE